MSKWPNNYHIDATSDKTIPVTKEQKITLHSIGHADKLNYYSGNAMPLKFYKECITSYPM